MSTCNPHELVGKFERSEDGENWHPISEWDFRSSMFWHFLDVDILIDKMKSHDTLVYTPYARYRYTKVEDRR